MDPNDDDELYEALTHEDLEMLVAEGVAGVGDLFQCYLAAVEDSTGGSTLTEWAIREALNAGIKIQAFDHDGKSMIIVPIVSDQALAAVLQDLEKGVMPWNNRDYAWLGGVCIYLPPSSPWIVTMQDKLMTPSAQKKGFVQEHVVLRTGDYYENSIEIAAAFGQSSHMRYHAMMISMIRIEIRFAWTHKLSDVTASNEVRVDAMLMSPFCSATTVHFYLMMSPHPTLLPHLRSHIPSPSRFRHTHTTGHLLFNTDAGYHGGSHPRTPSPESSDPHAVSPSSRIQSSRFDPGRSSKIRRASYVRHARPSCISQGRDVADCLLFLAGSVERRRVCVCWDILRVPPLHGHHRG